MDQTKRLTCFLFISGTLNIIFFCLMLYVMVRERPPAPYYELKPAKIGQVEVPLVADPTNAEILRSFRKLSFEQLVAKLSYSQQVENGYAMRDLALGSLVTFHHFDLARALTRSGLPQQRRKILIGYHLDGSPAEVTIYPGLGDKHFHAIMLFAQQESWPLTSKGLFLKLKGLTSRKDHMDSSLVESFYATPEFLALERLFQRSEASIQKEELLQVLLEGNWGMLHAFFQQQRIQQDLSPSKRQQLLLQYVEKGGTTAAYLLLKTDRDFASRKLPDHQVLAILELTSEVTDEMKQFSLEQLASPRSDSVWKLAAQRLYQFEGQTLPESFDREAIMAHFGQKPSPPQATALIPSTPSQPIPVKRQYVVQAGDSLWKISRQFKVGVQEIKKANQLKSDQLRPGQTLELPG